MRELRSCEFNHDSACVELKYSDGSMIAIDTIRLEDELVNGMLERTAYDYLVYEAPREFSELVFSGRIEEYLNMADWRDFRLED